jgi:hypothetical protein
VVAYLSARREHGSDDDVTVELGLDLRGGLDEVLEDGSEQVVRTGVLERTTLGLADGSAHSPGDEMYQQSIAFPCAYKKWNWCARGRPAILDDHDVIRRLDANGRGEGGREALHLAVLLGLNVSLEHAESVVDAGLHDRLFLLVRLGCV